MTARLSTPDRHLPLWIAPPMAGGLALGARVPWIDDALDSLVLGTVSLPIALGLLLMMYPVLAQVRDGEFGALGGGRSLLGGSDPACADNHAAAHVRAGLDHRRAAGAAARRGTSRPSCHASVRSPSSACCSRS